MEPHARHDRLDAVSVLYPAMSRGKRGYVFRLCAVLTEEVDIQVLRSSVRALAPQFPILYTHLKKTFFSYVHVPASDFDVVSQREPCLILPELYDSDKPSFRLYCEKHRITMDVFHANADGAAAIQYLQALLAEYYARAGDGGAPVPPASAEAVADDYLRHFDKRKNGLLTEKKSFSFRLAPKEGYVRLSCMSIDLEGVRARVKPAGFTVNDYLVAALYLAIVRSAHPPAGAPEICLSVPINLRPFFDSVTQRNFACYANVRLSGTDSLDDAMRSVHEQMQAAVQREHLLCGIAAIVKTTNHFFVRFTPRVLREYIIRNVYRFIAGRGVTTTLSNLGLQRPAPAVAEKLVRFEMYLGAGGGGMNASAVGCKGQVSMCVSASSEDRCIERELGALLRADGIAFTVSEQEFQSFQKIREQGSGAD